MCEACEAQGIQHQDSPAQKGLRDVFRNILRGINRIVKRESDTQESSQLRQTTQDEIREMRVNASVQLERYRQEVFYPNMDKITEYWMNGGISDAQFRLQAKKAIHKLLLSAAAAGVGAMEIQNGQLKITDPSKLDKRIIDRVDRELNSQVKQYLDRWIRQKDPQKPGSIEQAKQRGRMYGAGANAIAEEAIDKVTFAGFPDLPFYPRERERGTICRNNCCCQWVWEDVDYQKRNAKVYWRLDPECDHCETCLRRASRFNPLIIENGQFKNMPPNLAPYIAP